MISDKALEKMIALRGKRRPKQLAVIDQVGCTGCEVCTVFCPVDCIVRVPGPDHEGLGPLVQVDLSRCVGCTLCAQYCPWDTILMLPYDQAVRRAPELTIRTVVYPDAASYAEIDKNL